MTRTEITNSARILAYKLLAPTSAAGDGTPLWTSPVKWGAGYSFSGIGRFTIDHIVGPAYVLGWYEPEVTRVMNELVQRGDKVVDVGAHVGYLSIYLSKLVGHQGTVFSFEPAPRNREVMRQNVRQNRANNIQLFPYALSDTIGNVDFMIDPSSYENRIVDGSVNGHRVMTVPTTTLDLFVQSHQVEPAFIKLDVEGAEVAALQGARQTLRRYRPPVVAEVRDCNWRAVRSLMESMHYDSRVLSKPGSGPYNRGTPNVLFTPN